MFWGGEHFEWQCESCARSVLDAPWAMPWFWLSFTTLICQHIILLCTLSLTQSILFEYGPWGHIARIFTSCFVVCEWIQWLHTIQTRSFSAIQSGWVFGSGPSKLWILQSDPFYLFNRLKSIESCSISSIRLHLKCVFACPDRHDWMNVLDLDFFFFEWKIVA